MFLSLCHQSVPTHHGSGKQQQAHKKALEIYKYTCRQMAYDKGFLDIVDIIDMLDGRLFPGVKPRPRVPRLRRPPPTPVSSSESSDSDSSASSGDESDISGDTRSRLGADEDSTLELSPTRSASLSTPVGDTLTIPKLRRKKKKKEKLDVGDGESQAAEEDPEAGKKKKRRKHGEEEKTPSEADDRSQGKQSGSSQAGDLTDRSKGTAKSSEHTADGEGDGEEGVQDEGYETMSPSPNGISPAARNQQPQQLMPRFQVRNFVHATSCCCSLHESFGNMNTHWTAFGESLHCPRHRAWSQRHGNLEKKGRWTYQRKINEAAQKCIIRWQTWQIKQPHLPPSPPHPPLPIQHAILLLLIWMKASRWPWTRHLD